MLSAWRLCAWLMISVVILFYKTHVSMEMLSCSSVPRVSYMSYKMLIMHNVACSVPRVSYMSYKMLIMHNVACSVPYMSYKMLIMHNVACSVPRVSYMSYKMLIMHNVACSVPYMSYKMQDRLPFITICTVKGPGPLGY